MRSSVGRRTFRNVCCWATIPALLRGQWSGHKSGSVRSRPQLIVLLAAWLLATGVHWDAIQVFAWGRMFSDNARTLPVLAALRQTFDPQEMCGMCCAVQSAKREQREAAVTGQGEGKAPLVIQPVATVIIAAPDGQPWEMNESGTPAVERDAPPVPPPRGGAAHMSFA